MGLAFHWSKVFFLCLVLFAGLNIPVSGSALGNRDFEAGYDRKELSRIIKENNRTISDLNEHMALIQGDMAWLDLKIKRFGDYKRKVPFGMVESMEEKRKLLASVSREKARLESLSIVYGIKLSNLGSGFNGIRVAELPDSAKLPGMEGSHRAESDYSGKCTVSDGRFEELKSAVKKAGLNEWVEVVRIDDCVRIENRLPILFASGNARVVKEYKAFLKNFARFLKPYKVRILVDGYTDRDPIHTAKYPSNLELGATRAANIVHELVRSGIKPSVFKIATTGENRFYPQKPLKQKLLERRVQVSVIIQGYPLPSPDPLW